MRRIFRVQRHGLAKDTGLGQVIISYTSNISVYFWRQIHFDSFLKRWVITYGLGRKQLPISSICISVKLESTRRIISNSCQRRFLADESLLKLLLPTAGGSGTRLVVNNAGAVLEMCWKMTAKWRAALFCFLNFRKRNLQMEPWVDIFNYYITLFIYEWLHGLLKTWINWSKEKWNKVFRLLFWTALRELDRKSSVLGSN